MRGGVVIVIVVSAFRSSHKSRSGTRTDMYDYDVSLLKRIHHEEVLLTATPGILFLNTGATANFFPSLPRSKQTFSPWRPMIY
jgi:hypothetical protein